MLEHLQEHQLAIALDNCEWHRSRVNFLGYIILPEGVEMDQEKIRTIVEWKAPDSVNGVQSFLGLANFYRQFIEVIQSSLVRQPTLQKCRTNSSGQMNVVALLRS